MKTQVFIVTAVVLILTGCCTVMKMISQIQVPGADYERGGVRPALSVGLYSRSQLSY